MIKELSKEGIEVLDLYYCPHFIEDDCNCRKPMPAMFYWVSQDWFLRLDQTLYIGDSITDFLAILSADIGVLIGDNHVTRQVIDYFGISTIFTSIGELLLIALPINKNIQVAPSIPISKLLISIFFITSPI